MKKEKYEIHSRDLKFFDFLLQRKTPCSTETLLKAMRKGGVRVSSVTLRRDLSRLVKLGFLERQGKGRATTYTLLASHKMTFPIDEELYLKCPADERSAQESFNFEIFTQIKNTPLFNPDEIQKFQKLQNKFRENIKLLSSTLLKKEFERLAIELSWKSSAIEGNTYDLLDTEMLLKEGLRAKGKTKDEEKMILNHKKAIDFIYKHSTPFKEISKNLIVDLHVILMKDLGVSNSIRKRTVGITGTKYKPLDNKYQIEEAIEQMCALINRKENVFEKSFLALMLLNYIQPFEDGNKRMSRFLANAIFMAHKTSPVSFRSMDITSYKRAILLFYEKIIF